MQQNSKKYKITSNATVYQPGEIVEVTKRVYGGLEISNGQKKMTVPLRSIHMHMKEVA